MSVTRYEGKTFAKQGFIVEESYFLNCVLKDCDLFYSGGDFDWLNCHFDNCFWHFRGPALKTMQIAQMLGMTKTPQTPIPSPASGSKMMN